ncbi:ethanolamine ammonia-lyase subunit EutC [Bosea sp. CS1GBMeth4]|uniref:ethanolamine ammonia-lyase subunit EutC n=1 Tax=Bosea sp. CS1GBMeth4 TaxID=1892849 RepID=UPI0016494790|nr:ethanolamine ammonia-lyase subunit EutC [Bosea sp. CS1GBMeth4]
MSEPDLWRRLAQSTPARLRLGRSGAGLPTRETLRFSLAHAQARDAVHASLDADGLERGLAALGLATVRVSSRAAGRDSYLLRPDLGRTLADAGRERLTGSGAGPVDLALIVADGLSARAVTAHAAKVVAALLPPVRQAGWRIGPVAIAEQARVALGDEIGALLQARLALVLIGERPGLSSPDSLGLYLTYAPRPGRSDGERNCISNIHAAGLSHDQAAAGALWLIRAAFARQMTGVALKDESGATPAIAEPGRG